jgi:FKBP-type peptidyl-prolyl cis-trans isomerase 2
MDKKKLKSKRGKSSPKYAGIISKFQQRFPKWKYFALGIIAIIAIAIGLGVGLQPSSDTSTTAQTGDTIKVSYIGTYDNGSVFDSANSSAPWEFTIGNKSAIPGFEKSVIGMSVNQTKKIRVAPDEGYGPAEITANINEFPDGVAVGQYYNHTLENGVYIQSARVTAINGSIVTLQNLTPMAGLYLNFEITLIELTKAGQTSSNSSS